MVVAAVRHQKLPVQTVDLVAVEVAVVHLFLHVDKDQWPVEKEIILL